MRTLKSCLKQSLLPLLLTVLLLLTESCATHIKPERMETADAKFSMAIGGTSTEFKDDIITRLVSTYKDRGNIDIMDFDALQKVSCSDYDIVLVMDECQAWTLFNDTFENFASDNAGCNNIVYFFTAGDEWQCEYEGLDAVTSASIAGDEDRVFNELKDKIDALL